jgi:hypothetical protein
MSDTNYAVGLSRLLWLALLTSLAATLAAFPASAADRPDPVRSEVIPYDGGGANCSAPDIGDPYFIDGYCTDTALDETPLGFRDLAGNPCKRVTVYRGYRSWAGFIVWKYFQRVTFCYNGSVITYSYRTRWAEFYNGAGFYWDFMGHISNSCNTETCSERVGVWKAYYGTQGKFQACLVQLGIRICTTRLPGVGIEAYGNGVWHWNTWG